LAVWNELVVERLRWAPICKRRLSNELAWYSRKCGE